MIKIERTKVAFAMIAAIGFAWLCVTQTSSPQVFAVGNSNITQGGVLAVPVNLCQNQLAIVQGDAWVDNAGQTHVMMDIQDGDTVVRTLEFFVDLETGFYTPALIDSPQTDIQTYAVDSIQIQASISIGAGIQSGIDTSPADSVFDFASLPFGFEPLNVNNIPSQGLFDTISITEFPQISGLVIVMYDAEGTPVGIRTAIPALADLNQARGLDTTSAPRSSTTVCVKAFGTTCCFTLSLDNGLLCATAACVTSSPTVHAGTCCIGLAPPFFDCM